MVYYLDTVSKLATVISKSSFLDDSHVADDTFSKEAFSLLHMSKMAEARIDIKAYRHSQAVNGGFFQVK